MASGDGGLFCPRSEPLQTGKDSIVRTMTADRPVRAAGRLPARLPLALLSLNGLLRLIRP